MLDGYSPAWRLRLRAPGGIEAVGTSASASWVVPRRVLDTRLVERATLAAALGHHLRHAAALGCAFR